MTSPDEVFGVLGNETRMSILQAIWDADVADHPQNNVLPYSELQDLVGVANSGRFNYHLKQLTGRFIRKTDNGYQLREAGIYLVQAILAGTLIEEPSLAPSPIDSECPYCGTTLEVYYDDEELHIRCREGRHSGPSQKPGTILNFHFPPAGLRGRTPEELAGAAMGWFDAMTAPLLDDICPKCASRTTMSVAPCENHHPVDGVCEACEGRWAVFTTTQCSHCAFSSTVPAYYHLFSDIQVVDWFRERGIEFTGLSWESMEYITRSHDEVVSTDPLRVEVRIPVKGETVTVTLNEDMNVVELTQSFER